MSPVYFVNKVPSTLIGIPGPQRPGTGGTLGIVIQESYRLSG